MNLTLNFEAPGRSTVDLAATLSEYFVSDLVKLRAQPATYPGADGALTLIARIDSNLDAEDVYQAVFAVSCVFDQDCIAVELGNERRLIGPRSDKWMPFNPAHFVGY